MNDTMLRREPTITNKKRSEKGRTICEIGTASPPRHPRILHPVRTFTPTTTQNSGVARRGRAREGETAFANSECFPFSQPCPRQSVPSKGKKPTHSSSQQQKKVPANKDATTALSYREELHRPEAPQGRTRPLSVTGSPISCDSTLPFQGFSSVASI